MGKNSIYWYDFETFGANPRRDRASQFAGRRTSEDLEPLEEPLVMYCKPADDFIPDPMACLITGITPAKARKEGLIEVEFIAAIEQEFSRPGTCVAGYNSIRFDDEMTRQLLYRNFYDPYEREWKNGNSRWDILDMLRLCAATRPQGIEWPRRGDGNPSFRLEDLTAANNIEHSDAHDALSDVEATIALAKLVKDKQPKLFEYVYSLRDKHRVQAELDLVTRKPVLHISGMYPSHRGCLALVMPLCQLPGNKNGIIVYDLRQDPRSWFDLPVQEIRELLFTASKDMPEDAERIALKVIHINRCPVFASPAVLSPERARHFELDIDECKRHWELLARHSEVIKKLQAVYSEEPVETSNDPDFMIYTGGFFSDSDKALMRTVRETAPSDLARLDLPFRDSRMQEMLLRFRARNYPETLSSEEREDWEAFRKSRLLDPLAQAEFKASLDEAIERADESGSAVLAELESYVDGLLESVRE